MPPNSSGHILLQELNIVELFDLASLGHNTTECVHLMVEAKKLGFADREKFMADPNWVDVPIGGLLSKEYAAAQAKRIDPHRAAVDVPAGGPENCLEIQPASVSRIAGAMPFLCYRASRWDLAPA